MSSDCDYFSRIFASPGLSFIADDIIECLDAETLASAELVCKVRNGFMLILMGGLPGC
jgi:hypothetical protein